jgi:hypothetical protein
MQHKEGRPIFFSIHFHSRKSAIPHTPLIGFGSILLGKQYGSAATSPANDLGH